MNYPHTLRSISENRKPFPDLLGGPGYNKWRQRTGKTISFFMPMTTLSKNNHAARGRFCLQNQNFIP